MREEESKEGIEENGGGFCDKSKAFFFSFVFFFTKFSSTQPLHNLGHPSPF
jgi:hypothetical protein